MTWELKSEFDKAAEPTSPAPEATCACLTATYQPRQYPDGTQSERWACVSCERHFVPASRLRFVVRQRDAEERDAMHSGGILSDVCDAAFGDDSRAEMHSYDGVVERVKLLVGQVDRLRAREAALVAAIVGLAAGYVYSYPIGTGGGERGRKRSREPQPGDFVWMTMHLQPGSLSQFGRLVSMSEGNEYTREYVIDCLDGERRSWVNVRVYALPVGNPHGDSVDDWFAPTGPLASLLDGQRQHRPPIDADVEPG